MNENLSERIKSNIVRLQKQDLFLTKILCFVGLVALCMMGLAVFNKVYYNSQFEQLYNPKLGWAYIASIFIFVSYCLIGILKFRLYCQIWKLKKGLLAVKWYYLFRSFGAKKEQARLVVNEKALEEICEKRIGL